MKIFVLAIAMDEDRVSRDIENIASMVASKEVSGEPLCGAGFHKRGQFVYLFDVFEDRGKQMQNPLFDNFPGLGQ